MIQELEKTARLNKWKHSIHRYVTAGDYLKGHSILNTPYTKNEIREKLDKLFLCAHTLEIREYKREENPLVLHNANYCKMPDICPVCADRAQARALAKYSDPIKRAAGAHSYVYMLTATIRDGENLSERLAVLRDSWKRFRLMGQKRVRHISAATAEITRSAGEFGKVRACIAKLETQKGAHSGLWHPHFHCLIFADEPIDYKTRRLEEFGGRMVNVSNLSAQWITATRGQGINIDCREISATPRFWHGMPDAERRRIARLIAKMRRDGVTREDSILQQSIEVLKYTTKFSQYQENGAPAFKPADYLTVLYSLAGRRRRDVYGEFRKHGAVEYQEDETETPAGIHYAYYHSDKAQYELIRAGQDRLIEATESARRRRFAWLSRIQGRYRAAKNRFRNNRDLFLHYTIPDLAEIEKVLDDLRARFRQIIRDHGQAMTPFPQSTIDHLLTGT